MKQKDFNKIFTNAIRGFCEFPENLISQIKDGPKLNARRALEVYQEDYQARLTEALKNTYQAIYFLIGDEDFHIIARDYITFYSSSFSNLDDYGNHLNDFLKKHTVTEKYIFISELAHFEWNFKELFHKKNQTGLDANELIAEFQTPSNKFLLISTLEIFHYNYAVTKLYSLKNANDQSIENEVNYSSSEYIIMFKESTMVKTISLSKEQWEIMNLLLTPHSINEIIQNAPATMTPEKFQSLFYILGKNRLLLKLK